MQSEATIKTAIDTYDELAARCLQNNDFIQYNEAKTYSKALKWVLQEKRQQTLSSVS